MKPCLIVGDERAKRLCDVYPKLLESSTLAWYPGGRLEKILAGAIMRLNSSYKVLVIVALLNDFVTEKPQQRALYMANPSIDNIGAILNKFAGQIKMINPRMKVVITVPAYIDFILYSKRLKHLHPGDFARLDSFSSQVMDSFKKLHNGLRYMSKNIYCFNFNISLRDRSKIIKNTSSGKPPQAATIMQFFDGTYEDGFNLTDEALGRVGTDLNSRLEIMLSSMLDSEPVSTIILILIRIHCFNILISEQVSITKFLSESVSITL